MHQPSRDAERVLKIQALDEELKGLKVWGFTQIAKRLGMVQYRATSGLENALIVRGFQLETDDKVTGDSWEFHGETMRWS